MILQAVTGESGMPPGEQFVAHAANVDNRRQLLCRRRQRRAQLLSCPRRNRTVCRPPCSAARGGLMGRSCWLVSAPYDLTFITGSAILLFVPHAIHLLWPSNIVVDLVIAAAIGGPHLFATYTLTFMEPNFRRRYPRYTAAALLLPLVVLVTAIVHLDLLVTAFFFLAALHVIHQAGYVADSYRARRPEPAAARGLSRLIDYGLLLSSLFVLATFRFAGAPLRIFGMELSEHPFATGGRRLLFPGILQAEVLAWALMLAFALCAGAFLVKSAYEAAQGRPNLPKMLHMVLAAGLFFVTPALRNLDVAFQGLNTWHSFQYLAVVIFLNRCRQAQGLIGSPGWRASPPAARACTASAWPSPPPPGSATWRYAGSCCCWAPGPATRCSSTTSPSTWQCCRRC